MTISDALKAYFGSTRSHKTYRYSIKNEARIKNYFRNELKKKADDDNFYSK